jgi:hypothetical protein
MHPFVYSRIEFALGYVKIDIKFPTYNGKISATLLPILIMKKAKILKNIYKSQIDINNT